MKVLVVGLGLIGGSFAKAIKKYTSHFVLGYNRSEEVLKKALEVSAIDKIATDEDIKEADIVFVALYPKTAADFIKSKAHLFKEGAIVFDGCGVKREVYKMLGDCVKDKRFTFIGGHPMAGKEVSGFDNADADLFKNASLILTPEGADDGKVEILKNLALSIGFGGVKITDAKTHDFMIAYTSQLAHVLACSYIFDPLALEHKGFSAGSFLDVTRVARINETMWAELFLENKEALSKEIEVLINNLSAFKSSIDESDEEALRQMMRKSCEIKEKL